MVEVNASLVYIYFEFFEEWSAGHYVFAIRVGQPPLGQTFAYVLFVFWMNVACFSNIDDYGHPGMGNVQSFSFRISYASVTVSPTRFVLVVREVCQLDPVEWEFSLSPYFAPTFHQSVLLVVVGFTFVAIGFSLVPNNSANAVWNQWVNHAAVESSGILVTIS